jgi:hypothetical protein
VGIVDGRFIGAGGGRGGRTRSRQESSSHGCGGTMEGKKGGGAGKLGYCLTKP